MGRSTLRRRVFAAVTVPLTIAAMALATSTAAHADTDPKSGDSQTVTADSLPTTQIDGVAWSQVIVGDTVYVGGDFSHARPAGAKPGVDEVSRSNLLAYNLTTGELLPWAPHVNGAVRAIAASPDGRTVYAVGMFSKASLHSGGSSDQTRTRIASFDAASGDLSTTFHPTLNSTAYAVAARGNTVYVGGHFTSASGKTRSHDASFSATDGGLNSWDPKTNNDVLAIVVDSSNSSVVIGGHFSKVNGETQRGSQRVNTGSGTENLSWALNSVVGNNGDDAAIWSLSTTNGVVYGTGYSYHPTPGTPGKRLEGTFAASFSGGSIKWIEDCHGDSYGAAVSQHAVYIAGHPHDCARIGGFKTVPYDYQRALAFTTGATHTLKKNTTAPYSDFGGQPAPTIEQWYPYFDAGTITGQNQGPWTVSATDGYVAFAGEFKHINNHLQEGLGRFAYKTVAPDKQGPMLSGSSFDVSAKHGSKGDTVTFDLNYDRDNQYLDYAIYRGSLKIKTLNLSSGVWEKGGTSTYLDGHGVKGTTYHLRATDPSGNYVSSETVTAK